MAESKHTPGPWHLSEDGRTILSNQSHPVAFLSEPGHRQVMSRSGGIYTGNDGPLLAAAPELLEAAKRMVAAMGSDAEHTVNGLALMHAIAKAEGRSDG